MIDDYLLQHITPLSQLMIILLIGVRLFVVRLI